VRIELFLRNVSLTSNWSNEFLQELASQLNLRVNQFEIVNFYVVGASGLNITMDIAPYTGISFAADQVKAMNYSLTLHTVRIDPVLVGDYNLLNLTWFRPLAPAPGNSFRSCTSSVCHNEGSFVTIQEEKSPYVFVLIVRCICSVAHNHIMEIWTFQFSYIKLVQKSKKRKEETPFGISHQSTMGVIGSLLWRA